MLVETPLQQMRAVLISPFPILSNSCWALEQRMKVQGYVPGAQVKQEQLKGRLLYFAASIQPPLPIPPTPSFPVANLAGSHYYLKRLHVLLNDLYAFTGFTIALISAL
jgi:hypothetical protein